MKNTLVLFALMSYAFANAQIAEDKILHFVAGSYAAATGYYLADDIKWNNKNTAIGLALTAGIAKEIYDYSSNGKFDEKDLLATAVGGIFVTYTIELFKNKKKKKRKK